MFKYGDGYIGVLAPSLPFESFTNSIKIFNDAIKKSSRTRKDFDLTILTYPYLIKSSSEGDRAPITGGTKDELGSDLPIHKRSGVDRIILAVDADKDYDVNETIEFVK